jgi:hypothetical protein
MRYMWINREKTDAAGASGVGLEDRAGLTLPDTAISDPKDHGRGRNGLETFALCRPKGNSAMTITMTWADAAISLTIGVIGSIFASYLFNKSPGLTDLVSQCGCRADLKEPPLLG